MPKLKQAESQVSVLPARPGQVGADRSLSRGARIVDWREFYAVPRGAEQMLFWAATHSPMMTELLQCRRILEVGTGTGMLSGLLSRTAQLVATIDYNPDVLATAGQFFSSIDAPVRRVHGDGFRLPFEDGSFDAAFSQGLIEHFDDTDVCSLVAEQVRVAGVVFVSVPSFFYPRVGRRGPGLVGNERLLRRRGWERTLRAFDPEVSYYSDYKVATIAGWTFPWPNQLLIRVSA